MKGAIQLARIFGIPIRIHWTFGLIFIWVLYEGFQNSLDLTVIVWWELFLLALFSCVVLHEFGHALTARRFGVNTQDIILSPIGGIARLDQLPEKPFQEFMVAIAGPLVNIGIALLLSLYFLLIPEQTKDNVIGFLLEGSESYSGYLGPADLFIPGLIGMNVIIAAFNMLPAFPMDGGRVLRALLSIKMGRTRATMFASYIGQFLAVLLFAYGIMNLSWVTALIGVFVFTTASSEYRMVKTDSLLEHFKVSGIFRRNFTKFYKKDPISLAMEELKHGSEKSFLVFDEWQNLIGVLSEKNILKAYKNGEEDIFIEDYLDLRVEALLPSDTLKTVFNKMNWRDYTIMPVYEQEKLQGVVEMERLKNFLRIQEKLKK